MILGSIGISDSVSAFDPDAQAYFTANSAYITSTADKNAINNFFVGLKTDGVYSKIRAMHLPIWGAAAGCKWNLVNPLDTNAAHRLTYASGMTFQNSVGDKGMTSNGTAYADTNLNQSVLSQNSTHLSFYSRTNLNANQAEIGIHAGNYNLMQIRVSGTGYYLINTGGLPTAAETDSRGFFIGNRQASNDIDAWKNGVKILNGTTASGTVASGNLFLLAYNNIQGGGGASAVSTKQCAFASTGDGLTDTEAANFSNRVNTLLTYFGINMY